MKQAAHKNRPVSNSIAQSVSTNAAQLKKLAPATGIQFTVQRQENKTGMSNQLKSGIETLSGVNMNDVKVHYNSAKPAQLNAHAYAQGTDIHVGPGQEKHVPHEAWHVVQQKQGRVKPTMQMQGVNINDNKSLETEADVMGSKAIQMKFDHSALAETAYIRNPVVQRQTWSRGAVDGKQTDVTWTTGNLGGSVIGVKMVANPLGPEHLQGGPPKSGAQKNLMNQLETEPGNANDRKYIRGHLLNDNVGGPGEDYNLFPITGNANKEHEQKIESRVKDWVNNKKQWVKYEVSVQPGKIDLSHSDEAKNHVDAIFNCQASVLDPAQGMKEIHTIAAGIKSQYKVSHDNKVAEDKENYAAVGTDAQTYDPQLSKSKKVEQGGYDEEVMLHLVGLMSDGKSRLLLKKALLQYEGIGKVTVDVLGTLQTDDESTMDQKQKTALKKIFTLGNDELLSVMGDVYDDIF